MYFKQNFITALLSILLIIAPLSGYSKMSCAMENAEVAKVEMSLNTEMMDHSHHLMIESDHKPAIDDHNCCADSCECSVGCSPSSLVHSNGSSILSHNQSSASLVFSNGFAPLIEKATPFRPPILS